VVVVVVVMVVVVVVVVVVTVVVLVLSQILFSSRYIVKNRKYRQIARVAVL